MKLEKIYLASAILGGLMMTSCSDLLDVDHPSEQDPKLTFSSVEDATTAINGIYVLFAEDPFTSRMSNVWMQNTDVETQNPNAGRPSGGHRSDIWGLQAAMDVSFGDIYNAWNNCLNAIELANKAIDGVNTSKSTDSNILQIQGEAACLKAWRYLMMCNFWGDVPYYDTSSKWGDELDKNRTDKNYIYSGCLRDLVKYEPNMKWSDQNTGGIERMNRDFAIGLIAKMALFRAGYGMTSDGTMKKADDYLDVNGDAALAVTYTDVNGTEKTARNRQEYYQMAKDYCMKLIQMKGRELNPDYKAAFNNEVNRLVKNNDEVLYEVAFLESKGGDVGWCIGVTNTNAKTKGTTTNQVGINPIYYMSFADNDVRRDATCSRYQHDNDTIKVNETGKNGFSAYSMNVAKWDRFLCPAALGAGSSKGTGINWPLMRYSEVLLMLAEAENELNGPTALAKEQLRKVRARAFNGAPNYSEQVDNYVANLNSKEAFFEAIVNERAWEFGGECLRKWDLQRWNNYGEKLNDNIYQQLCYGIASIPEILENDPSVAQKYPDYVKYLDKADRLYYHKEKGTKDVAGLFWYNDKYKIDTRDVGSDSIFYCNWGRQMIKTTTVYLYNGKEYESASKVTNSETGVVTYTLGTAPNSVVVTVNKGEDTNITRRRTYSGSDYSARIYRGYTGDTGKGTGAVPYVLPIGTTTLSSSKVLNNNGYCFGYDGEGTNVKITVVETPYK